MLSKMSVDSACNSALVQVVNGQKQPSAHLALSVQTTTLLQPVVLKKHSQLVTVEWHRPSLPHLVPMHFRLGLVLLTEASQVVEFLRLKCEKMKAGENELTRHLQKLITICGLAGSNLSLIFQRFA